MARAGLSREAVVDAAVAHIDAEGPQALTLAAIAAKTGVATPSLYKHVKGLPELRRLVGVRVMNELADRTTAAVIGHSGAKAVRAFMLAYRKYALDHPHRYAAMPQSPDPDPELVAAGHRLLDILFAVLAGCGVTGTPAVDLVRGIRAAGHGFAVLQSGGAFQQNEDVDDSYLALIDRFTVSLP